MERSTGNPIHKRHGGFLNLTHRGEFVHVGGDIYPVMDTSDFAESAHNGPRTEAAQSTLARMLRILAGAEKPGVKPVHN